MGYWEQGGERIFVSITSTRSRPITSVTSTWCWLVKDWQDAFKLAQDWLADHRYSADKIEIYDKPRLCEKCIRHATVPMIFDIAEHKEECLCFIEKTPCGNH